MENKEKISIIKVSGKNGFTLKIKGFNNMFQSKCIFGKPKMMLYKPKKEK